MSIALPISTFGQGPSVQATPAPPAPHGERRLIDSHGRTIRDLRLSITDRCNFRCVYCMEPDVEFLDRTQLLSVDELLRVARLCIGLGVTKVRVTGGEPTVHPQLKHIISGLSDLRPMGLEDIALTTNGSRMDPASLVKWRVAGLDRITVSIDSLRPDRFATITRSNCPPETVVRGIRDAIGAGFTRVKANAVVVRGHNEDEVAELAGLARDLGIDMRFIEFMPLDAGHSWDPAKLVSAAEIIERIAAVHPLTPLGRDDDSSTSNVYAFADGSPGRVGVIAPVTSPFCGACSRLRITADAKIRPCLFSLREFDLLGPVRSGETDEQLEQRLIDATWTKQPGHGIRTAGFHQPDRAMFAIGG